MSDINTPQGRQHPEDPAEGADDASARDGSPSGGDSGGSDDAAPDEDMSSYNIQPPPEEGEVPGVPDASNALGDDGSDEPGSNATGVGA